MKKLIVLVLAFTSLGFHAKAVPDQEPSQKVIALSGVKMRTAPDLSSKTIKIIEFAEELTVLDTIDGSSQQEWLEGNWVLVESNGMKGYVFNAFITDLPIPMEDYELTAYDGDSSHPLISWVENNHTQVKEADTVLTEHYYKETRFFEDGMYLTTKESPYNFEVRLYIPQIRLGDAYNLMRSMMLTRSERSNFEESTLFIKNRQGVIDKVRIELDAPIDIIKINNGIEIKVTSYQSPCGISFN